MRNRNNSASSKNSSKTGAGYRRPPKATQFKQHQSGVAKSFCLKEPCRNRFVRYVRKIAQH
jgi:hypothetical protein